LIPRGWDQEQSNTARLAVGSECKATGGTGRHPRQAAFGDGGKHSERGANGVRDRNAPEHEGK
jgi:hypothetical protein